LKENEKFGKLKLPRVRGFALLISALKSKLFPAEDRQPKNVIFGWLPPLRGDINLTVDVQISMRKSVKRSECRVKRHSSQPRKGARAAKGGAGRKPLFPAKRSSRLLRQYRPDRRRNDGCCCAAGERRQGSAADASRS
jgi:hypothetical protein